MSSSHCDPLPKGAVTVMEQSATNSDEHTAPCWRSAPARCGQWLIEKLADMHVYISALMLSLMTRLGLAQWWQKRQPFTRQQLEDYQDTTYFNSQDILRLYRRFYELNPDKVPRLMHGNRPAVTVLTYEEIETMPELRENPFRRRICEVFSEDGYGNLTFDDFLDMFSALSESAPLDLKLKYAFRVFDFDKDDFLGPSDLSQTVRAITRDDITEEEVQFVVDRVLEEADLDGDQSITFAEFEHVVSRSPDFIRTFHIRI